MKFALEISITWLLFGTMLACIALMLLGDHRGIVLSRSRMLTSIRVLLHAVLRPSATMEYFGIVLMVISAWFFIAGLCALATWLGGVLAGLVKIWSPLHIF